MYHRGPSQANETEQLFEQGQAISKEDNCYWNKWWPPANWLTFVSLTRKTLRMNPCCGHSSMTDMLYSPNSTLPSLGQYWLQTSYTCTCRQFTLHNSHMTITPSISINVCRQFTPHDSHMTITRTQTFPLSEVSQSIIITGTSLSKIIFQKSLRVFLRGLWAMMYACCWWYPWERRHTGSRSADTFSGISCKTKVTHWYVVSIDVVWVLCH